MSYFGLVALLFAVLLTFPAVSQTQSSSGSCSPNLANIEGDANLTCITVSGFDVAAFAGPVDVSYPDPRNANLLQFLEENDGEVVFLSIDFNLFFLSSTELSLAACWGVDSGELLETTVISGRVDRQIIPIPLVQNHDNWADFDAFLDSLPPAAAISGRDYVLDRVDALRNSSDFSCEPAVQFFFVIPERTVNTVYMGPGLWGFDVVGYFDVGLSRRNGTVFWALTEVLIPR